MSEMKFHIRNVKIDDAISIIDHYNIVGGETDYHTFGFGEYDKSVEEQEKIILESNTNNTSLFLIVEVDSKIIGVLTLNSGKSDRVRHRGNLGITIQKKYWNMRIGTNMMEAFLKWCNENDEVKKINLMVHEENKNAIHLYMKLGFDIEGKSTLYFNKDGNYYDAIHMGKKIGI